MDLVKMIAMGLAYRAGAPLGDVAVLKLDALSAPSAEMTEKLADVRGYTPLPDVTSLRQLPDHTLGREYARFLDTNAIEPLAISAAVRRRFRDNPYALRYTTTHDLHHVLTGFDATLAGEAGVLAFTVGQGSAPVSRRLLWIACVLYSLVAPLQVRKIWHNRRAGLALGEQAKLVIAERIETEFEEPLDAVRNKLRIQLS
jgi:ubiquinone biosynthesis protein Coq4